MITDHFLQFDPAASAITVTRDSTNVINNGAPVDAGGTVNMWVNVFVQTTFTAAGAATLTIAFQGAPDNAGAAGTWTTFLQTDAIPVASLVAPGVVSFQIPPKSIAIAKNVFPQWWKLVYTVATGPMTAGTVQAEFSDGPAGEPITHNYASGFTVTN